MKVGDIVYFNKHSAFPVKIDGVEYRILPVKEILIVADKPQLDIPAEPTLATVDVFDNSPK